MLYICLSPFINVHAGFLLCTALLAALCAAASAEEAHLSKASVDSAGRGLLDAGKHEATDLEGRGLLDTRRELSTLAASLCIVQNIDVYNNHCDGSGNYPISACCSGKSSSSSCDTNDGAAVHCEDSAYLGCCPQVQ